MQKYIGYAIAKFDDGTTGNVIAAAAAEVRVTGTGSLATLYATNSTGGATLSNPLTTDSNGMFEFYAANNRYNITLSKSGTTIVDSSLTDIVLYDIADDLTSAELTQLANIDATTISATQWGYLGVTNQGLATTDNVTFADGNFTGNVGVDGNITLGDDVSAIINVKGGASTSSQIRFFDSGTGRARIGVPTGQTYLSLSGSDSLTADMAIDSAGNVGIGTSSPDGALHVHTASAGTVTPSTIADDLTVENSGSTGISILAPDANNQTLAFGCPSDNDYFYLQGFYNAGSPVGRIGVNGATAITIDSSQNATFAGAILNTGGGYTTLASGESQQYTNSTNGLTFGGKGTTNDMRILNGAGLTVMDVPAGTQNATFAGDVTVNNSATTTIMTVGGVDGTAAAGKVYLRTGSTKYAWSLSAQSNIDNGFEITPSTAVGGITFSTPAFSIDGATSNATFTSRVLMGADPGSSAKVAIQGTGTTSATFPLYMVDSLSVPTHTFSDNGDAYHSGNVGIGTAPSSTIALNVKGTGTEKVLLAQSSAGQIIFETDTADLTYSGTPSGANSALRVREDGTTARSINASGTINASGADYAEYEIKSDSNATVNAADVIGFDGDGKVTTYFSESISFAVKSTNPNIVGGDVWAVTPRPEIVEVDAIEYTGSEKPTEPTEPTEVLEPELVEEPEVVLEPEALDEIDSDELDEEYEALKAAYDTFVQESQAYTEYLESLSTYEAYQAEMATYSLELEQYNTDLEQYESDQQAHQEATDAEQIRVDTINADNLAEWKVQHEAERATVDRIAYCGKVPVNGAPVCNVGDHLIAIEGDNDSISLIAKQRYESFEDSDNSVGRVKSFGNDNRPVIIVKVG